MLCDHKVFEDNEIRTISYLNNAFYPVLPLLCRRGGHIRGGLLYILLLGGCFGGFFCKIDENLQIKYGVKQEIVVTPNSTQIRVKQTFLCNINT